MSWVDLSVQEVLLDAAGEGARVNNIVQFGSAGVLKVGACQLIHYTSCIWHYIDYILDGIWRTDLTMALPGGRFAWMHWLVYPGWFTG
jgi:hypothetical protein